MARQLWTNEVIGLVELLSRGQYDAAVASCASSRVSSLELRNAIEDYGRTLIFDWDLISQNLVATRIAASSSPSWAVDLPLVTAEEGRSDLELRLTVTLISGVVSVEFR